MEIETIMLTVVPYYADRPNSGICCGHFCQIVI